MTRDARRSVRPSRQRATRTPRIGMANKNKKRETQNDADALGMSSTVRVASTAGPASVRSFVPVVSREISIGTRRVAMSSSDLILLASRPSLTPPPSPSPAPSPASFVAARDASQEKILRRVHELYEKGLCADDAEGGTIGLLEIAHDPLLNVQGVWKPRKKVNVMIVGNHSAGKSSFINWYVGESVQTTGVAIETRGFTYVTSGRKARSPSHTGPHTTPFAW